ncbi:hypothetical protein HPB47_011707 [Ixodes persulcatus]|uniref:Uncharacterized protein n=1 Tax=Ixodes persulcatus TaxID=34615 RepID=A0AC60NVS6_IXOPE|nr:hypothetical protein HPB47_011707 [Ixodes persulcatus]
MKILRAEWQRQAPVYRDLLRAVLCDSNQEIRDNNRLREFFNIVERNTEILWRLTLQRLRTSLPKRQPVAHGNVQSRLQELSKHVAVVAAGACFPRRRPCGCPLNEEEQRKKELRLLQVEVRLCQVAY